MLLDFCKRLYNYMTGFFRGPSLFSHVVILGLIMAVGVPFVAEWLDSTGLAFCLGFGFAICYAILAIIVAARKKRPHL